MAARCLTMLSTTRYEIPLTRNLHIPFSSSPLHARSPTRKYISAVPPVCRLCHPWVPSSQTCADKLRTSVSANFIPNPQILRVLYRSVLYILLLSEQFLLPEQFSLPEQSKAPKHVAIFRGNPVWMLQIDDLQGSTSQFAFLLFSSSSAYTRARHTYLQMQHFASSTRNWHSVSCYSSATRPH